MKGAALYKQGEMQDTQEIASNSKNTVTDANDLTQTPIALNPQEIASNSKNTVTDANDLTQSPFQLLKQWGQTPKPAPISWTVHHMFQKDSHSYIAGEPGVGKSWIMCDLAVSVATGTPFLGRQTQQGPVLIVNFDDSESLPRQYAVRTAHARGYSFDDDDLPLYYWQPDPDVAKPVHGILDHGVFDELAFQVAQLKPSMLIVDSFSSAFPSLDGNKGQDIVRGHEVLRQIRIKSPGCCLVLIDHTPKEVVLQSKRRGVSGSQQKNGQVRMGHIVGRVEPSEVGGGDVLRWDFFKVNACPPQRDFAIEREQTETDARLIVRDLPERERAPKATQSLEAALMIIRASGDAGIARTELIERVAAIANVGQRTIETVIDKEVRPHPQVIEKRLPGRGAPKGYKWRGLEPDDGSATDGVDSTQTSDDLTQPNDSTQTPIALNQTREGREKTISRNDAMHSGETPLREKASGVLPTAAEHPYTPGAARVAYLGNALRLMARQGKRFIRPAETRAQALESYAAACKEPHEARQYASCVISGDGHPDDATDEALRADALTLYGAARELEATDTTSLAAWAEAAGEIIKRRQRAN